VGWGKKEPEQQQKSKKNASGQTTRDSNKEKSPKCVRDARAIENECGGGRETHIKRNKFPSVLRKSVNREHLVTQQQVLE